jgi:hypothetical protein
MRGQAFSFGNLASYSAFPLHAAIIEDKEVVLDSGVSHGNNPAIVASASLLASPPLPPSDLHRISGRLTSLSRLVECLLPSAPVKATVDPPSPAHTLADDTTDVLPGDSPSIQLLSTISQDDVVCLVHYEGTVLPLVHPCDTAKSCNKKTHWTANELHCVMGCWKFCN